jgi:hypothetical protein
MKFHDAIFHDKLGHPKYTTLFVSLTTPPLLWYYASVALVPGTPGKSLANSLAPGIAPDQSELLSNRGSSTAAAAEALALATKW